LSSPAGLFADTANNLYFTDYSAFVVYRVNTLGIISTFAGLMNNLNVIVDHVAANTTSLNYPMDVYGDTAGSALYISERDACRIRKVTTATHIITTVAGAYGACFYDGDNIPATSAHLISPMGLFIYNNGLYIADYSAQRIRLVNLNTMIITTGKL
jgi:hypothetical protein